MKKLVLALVGVAIVTLAATASAEKMKIKMGTEGAYPPFNSIDASGKLVGFDIDIGDALCAAMNADCEWVTQDWDGIIPALLAKKFDTILASMSITEERKKKIAFTGKYYLTPGKFVRMKGSGIEITKASMKGKVVGVQSATIHENFLRGEYADVVEIKAYGKQDEANLDFGSGRVDLLLADSVALLNFLNSDAGKKAEYVGPDFSDPKYYGIGAGIGVRKEDTELLNALNKAIEQILSDGTYKKINAKYFDFDVYGG